MSFEGFLGFVDVGSGVRNAMRSIDEVAHVHLSGFDRVCNHHFERNCDAVTESAFGRIGCSFAFSRAPTPATTSWMISSRLRCGENPNHSWALAMFGTRRAMSSKPSP